MGGRWGRGGVNSSVKGILKIDKLCDFLFRFLHTRHFLKRIYSKRKEFAPTGSKFLSF